MARPRNWHAVNAILRRSHSFQCDSDTDPQASDWECDRCGEYLDPDGTCPECDEDEWEP